MAGRLRRGIGLALATGALAWLGYALPRSMGTPTDWKPLLPRRSSVLVTRPASSVVPSPVASSTSYPVPSPSANDNSSFSSHPSAVLTLSFTSTVAMRNLTYAPSPTAARGSSPMLSSTLASAWSLVDLPPCPSPPTSSHLWLARPFLPEANDWASPHYPYGSTADGEYLVHHGVDFGNPERTPVLAAGAGTVFYAGDDKEALFGPQPNFYGQLVIVTMDERYHGQPVFTLYGHLSSLAVRAGEPVKVGQKLGEVGATGVAMGPHLHFEVRVTDVAGYSATRNPELWLRPHPGHGLIAGRVLDEDGRLVPEVPLVLYPADDPDHPQREGWTYANQGVNSDEEWYENLVLGDVPAGEWALMACLEDRRLRQPVTVRPGQVSWVCLQPPDSPAKACP